MARVLFFGPAREAAGTRHATVDGSSVAEVMAASVARFGAELATMLPACRIWLNGDPVAPDSPVGHDDELAVLPPVSGG